MPNYLIAIINKMGVYNYLKSNQLSVFLSVLVFFPSARLLVVGSGHAAGLDLVFGLIPELLFVLILVWSLTRFLQDPDRQTHLLDKLVIAYFLFNILIGVYLAHDLKASLYGFRLTYLPMLGYFVCSYYWDKEADLERIFRGFFRILVLIAVIGLIIYFIFPEIHLYFHRIASGNQPIVMAFKGFIRMTSILWTPVVFAMLMLAGFIYWTYRYLKTGNNFALVFSLIMVNAVFLSVSRGPMITSAVAFVLLLFLGKRNQLKWIISGIILFEIAILTLFEKQFIPLMKWVFVSSKQTATLETSNTRVSLWTDVIHSIKHDPMGLGLGKAGHTAVQLFPPNTPGVSFASTDGWYFKLMIETGIPALVLYLAMALIFFVAMIKYISKNRFDFVTVIFTIFVVTGLVNIVSNVLDFYLFAYLYWFLLGIFVFKLKQNGNARKESFGSHS
ncbi:O-antigen ligase family protein [Fluviicola chungangensis]|uniref:O-antigen ligase family protein n=1 Tax=Fluviicola chungangensis TaxID=2597671 RepID=A0A556N0F6_9FLAO|nr:O-antigen ligase family protein [Fluviicola chungangensis]TSJ45674.1 O-antigen ligase family protein [Fluviicola chungangensis]